MVDRDQVNALILTVTFSLFLLSTISQKEKKKWKAMDADCDGLDELGFFRQGGIPSGRLIGDGTNGINPQSNDSVLSGAVECTASAFDGRRDCTQVCAGGVPIGRDDSRRMLLVDGQSVRSNRVRVPVMKSGSRLDLTASELEEVQRSPYRNKGRSHASKDINSGSHSSSVEVDAEWATDELKMLFEVIYGKRGSKKERRAFNIKYKDVYEWLLEWHKENAEESLVTDVVEEIASMSAEDSRSIQARNGCSWKRKQDQPLRRKEEGFGKKRQRVEDVVCIVEGLEGRYEKECDWEGEDENDRLSHSKSASGDFSGEANYPSWIPSRWSSSNSDCPLFYRQKDGGGSRSGLNAAKDETVGRENLITIAEDWHRTMPCSNWMPSSCSQSDSGFRTVYSGTENRSHFPFGLTGAADETLSTHNFAPVAEHSQREDDSYHLDKSRHYFSSVASGTSYGEANNPFYSALNGYYGPSPSYFFGETLTDAVIHPVRQNYSYDRFRRDAGSTSGFDVYRGIWDALVTHMDGSSSVQREQLAARSNENYSSSYDGYCSGEPGVCRVLFRDVEGTVVPSSYADAFSYGGDDEARRRS
ncbi:hypothetical protein GYMLUDRAFT_241904 [Collybiopsis luxurians FD-317 M1]|uniref:Uncharacterized protein n=1 Tax=Collybiopsis luxurians FD-317 M1 TaxID=944289 RepID=A0A0D0CUZ6_9AGAR|nr:hypothetical protein GYMLUDRAFT_241904 [Collybiopsis luxurians FD-317 M1]